MSKTMNTGATHFAVLSHSRAGRTWYQSKNVGELTCRSASVWATADKDEAIMLSGRTGGTVVTLDPNHYAR
jgi:hypothetical protein